MTAHDTNEPRGQSQGQPRNQRRGKDDAVDRTTVDRTTVDRTTVDRTILTLICAGTRRCRFVAAFMAITLSLVSQVAGTAYAQAQETVLYLDAPTVSNERATRAGEVASEYSKAGSPATDETLAWLAVPEGAQEPVDPPEEAREAFASVTAPSDGSGVTADAALAAGETMLAQLEGTEDGSAGELAAAEAVRPRLGDGSADGGGSGEGGATQDTQEDEDEPRYEAEAAPPATQPAAGDPGATPQPQYEPPELASSEETSGEGGGGEAPVTEPEKEPSGAGLVVAQSSPEPEPPEVGSPQAGERVELASAPSASQGEVQGREESSPTGPITDTGPAPLLAQESQEEPEGAAAGEPANEPTETRPEVRPEAEQTPSLASEPGVAPPEASPAEEAPPVEEVLVEEVSVEAAPAEETPVEAAPVEETPTEYAQSSPDSITAQPEAQPEAGQTPPPPNADTGPTGDEGSAEVAIVPAPTPEVVSEGPGSQLAEESEEFESPGSTEPTYEEQAPTPSSSGEYTFGEGEDGGSEEARAQPEAAQPDESIQEFEIVIGGAERGEESLPDDPSESSGSLEEAAPVPGDEDDGDRGGNGGDSAEGEEARNPTDEPPAPEAMLEGPAEDATPEDDPLPTPVEEGEGADEGGGATAEVPPNAAAPGGPASEQLRDERKAQRKEEREAVVEEQPVIEAAVPQPTLQEEVASGNRDEYRAMRREERQVRQEAAAIERERRAAGEESAHEVGQDVTIEQNGSEQVAVEQQQSVDEQQLLEQQVVEQQAAEQVAWQEEVAAADREVREAVHQAEREWQAAPAEQVAVDQAAMEQQVWRQAVVEEQQIVEEQQAIEQIAAQHQAAEQAAVEPAAVEEQLAAEQAAAEQAAVDAEAVEQAAMVAEQRANEQQVAEQQAAVDWAAAERQAVVEHDAIEQQDAYESQADPADAGMQSGYAQPATTDVPQAVPQQVQQAQPADYTAAVDTTVVAQPQVQPQVGQTTTQAQPVAVPPVENTAAGAGGGQAAVTESQQISESAINVATEVSQ